MNQLKVNQQHAIVSLFEQGWSKRRIARELDLDRASIRCCLNIGRPRLLSICILIRLGFDQKKKPELKPARPAVCLPEPYRNRLLSYLNSMAIDRIPLSEESQESAVQDIEHDLANGDRERRRPEVEAAWAARKLAKIQLPFAQVGNPLPPW